MLFFSNYCYMYWFLFELIKHKILELFMNRDKPLQRISRKTIINMHIHNSLKRFLLIVFRNNIFLIIFLFQILMRNIPKVNLDGGHLGWNEWRKRNLLDISELSAVWYSAFITHYHHLITYCPVIMQPK